MDIEQLKLIIEMMNDAGNNAFKFGVLWLLKGFLLDMVRYGVGIYLAIFLVKFVKRIMPALYKVVDESEN